MKATVYYSKINLSSHIHEVYEQPSLLKKYLDLITINLNNGISFIREDVRYQEHNEIVTYDATYWVDDIQKLDNKYNNSIAGRLYKKAKVFYKDIDSDGTLIRKSVENTEAVGFYFDVYKEIIVFYTTNRLGYSEFNIAFEGILNKSLEEYEIMFYVDLLKKPLSLAKIKHELKELGYIKKLQIDIKAPNPGNNLLNKIKKDSEEYLSNIKNANASQTSHVFISNSPAGLNIESTIIDKELDRISGIHSNLDEESAITNGYANIEATGKYNKFSTKDRPMKGLIDEEQKTIGGFIEAASEMLRALVFNRKD